MARCEGKVQEIWVHNDFVRVNMVGNEGLLAEKCWARDDMWLEIPSSDRSLQAYLSVLLAAKLSGSELLVRLTPGPADATTGQRPCRVFYIIVK